MQPALMLADAEMWAGGAPLECLTPSPPRDLKRRCSNCASQQHFAQARCVQGSIWHSRLEREADYPVAALMSAMGRRQT